jgi:hypothetical protein
VPGLGRNLVIPGADWAPPVLSLQLQLFDGFPRHLPGCYLVPPDCIAGEQTSGWLLVMYRNDGTPPTGGGPITLPDAHKRNYLARQRLRVSLPTKPSCCGLDGAFLNHLFEPAKSIVFGLPRCSLTIFFTTGLSSGNPQSATVLKTAHQSYAEQYYTYLRTWRTIWISTVNRYEPWGPSLEFRGFGNV